MNAIPPGLNQLLLNTVGEGGSIPLTINLLSPPNNT